MKQISLILLIILIYLTNTFAFASESGGTTAPLQVIDQYTCVSQTLDLSFQYDEDKNNPEYYNRKNVLVTMHDKDSMYRISYFKASPSGKVFKIIPKKSQLDFGKIEVQFYTASGQVSVTLTSPKASTSKRATDVVCNLNNPGGVNPGGG